MTLRAASSPTMPCSTASLKRLRMRGPIQAAVCPQVPHWSSPSLQEPPPAPPLVQVPRIPHCLSFEVVDNMNLSVHLYTLEALHEKCIICRITVVTCCKGN